MGHDSYWWVSTLSRWPIEWVTIGGILIPVIVGRFVAQQREMQRFRQQLATMESKIRLIDEQLRHLPSQTDINRLRVEIARLSNLIYPVKGLYKRIERLESQVLNLSSRR